MSSASGCTEFSLDGGVQYVQCQTSQIQLFYLYLAIQHSFKNYCLTKKAHHFLNFHSLSLQPHSMFQKLNLLERLQFRTISDLNWSVRQYT